MGFVNDVAKVGGFGLAGLALSKKKKPPVAGPPPMIQLSNAPAQPTSMIGPTRY